ncbi:MAG: hypothetical protein J5902_03355 [Paludibacteraceae bacterium]|nr:hypothetical protein [Paludibacteraceae bacterium]
MKKHLFIATAVAAVTVLFSACGGSSKMTISTSSSVDLARSIRYVPTLANITVQPNHVTATMTATELESLNDVQKRQAVAAKALATVNADILVAPQYSIKKGDDGKMISCTVVGYPATFTSFRPINESDGLFAVTSEISQKRPVERSVSNTLTVAEVEYGAKESITLTPADLAGKNEKTALALAKEKLLRQEKADFLYHPQYTTTIVNGAVSTFTLTAFPARYVNYRTATKDEINKLGMTKEPTVVYNNITADVKAVCPRVQKRVKAQTATVKEAELKEQARAAVLAAYNADFLLNEKIYVDYQDNVLTQVVVCGTPAVYANFRPYQQGDIIDVKIMPLEGDPSAEEEKPKGFFDSFKSLFKKK